jgi:hypothetical protein
MRFDVLMSVVIGRTGPAVRDGTSCRLGTRVWTGTNEEVKKTGNVQVCTCNVTWKCASAGGRDRTSHWRHERECQGRVVWGSESARHLSPWRRRARWCTRMSKERGSGDVKEWFTKKKMWSVCLLGFLQHSFYRETKRSYVSCIVVGCEICHLQ